MAQFFEIHPDNPQRRLIQQAVAIIDRGGLLIYPTDSSYALGCHIGDKAAMAGLDEIMKPDNKVGFTVLRQSEEKTLELTLTRMPDDVYARFVGEHMLDHVTVDLADAD